MRVKAIHQFHPSCSNGDGITNGMLFTRRLLRQLGFASEIYCDNIPADLAGEVKQRRDMRLQLDNMLLVHHSLGYDDAAWLSGLASPKVLVYHNITPEHLLPEDGPLRRLSRLGRQQLAEWAPGCAAAIGDSEINSRELIEAGYDNVHCIPLLVDTDLMRNAPKDMAAVASLRNAINLLFVGRICENKRQLELLDMLHELRHYADQPVRLILAGGVSSGEYEQKIAARIRELDLADHVLLAGKVPAPQLSALYRIADAYVSLSDHEGFGMPLIEAMLFDVPVIARGTTSIPDTMGTGGLILKEGSPREMAATVKLLLSEPGLRRKVLLGQRQNLERFAPERLVWQLAEFLRSLGIEVPSVPAPHTASADRPYWQIEGPFDSSYSLAIVNRQVARALAAEGADVGLRSMEGSGDFEASQAFLQTNPDCAAFVQRAERGEAPGVALRFCYPPQVDDMRGIVRAMHSYGWEETGFPPEYVDAFNRRLDMLTVLSRFVEKTMRDNGVRIPMAVVGGGVDQLLQVAPVAPQLEARSFRFLHVSSCFPRKGVDVLLRAYGKAFRNSEDVSLVIKTFPNPHNDVAEQLKRLRAEDPDFPHVEIINRDFSDGELVGLYQACHAYVATSRGEGLGLPLAEAMMFNLPAITTNWGGQLDFCDNTTAWMCDFRYVKAASHVSRTHSVWAEPDADHLAALLREVKDATPEQLAARTVPARERVMRELTWKRVAERTQDAVRSLAAQPTLRKEPKIAWLSSWNTRCGIATYSSFLSCGIPPARLLKIANRATERVEEDGPNVIRNWNQHYEESLDEVFDTLVAQGIGAVVIQYNFGFFTVPTLGRFLERLADAGIASHVFFHSTADLVRDGTTISLRSIASSLARADRIYVHGVHDLNRLKDYGLVDNVVFFPHGVLPTQRGSGDAERARLGLVGKKIIASYGFLLPHKGLQQLIEAFAIVAKQDPDAHLLMANALYPVSDSVKEQQACEALVDKLKLQRRVTMVTDFLPDEQSLALLRTADVIVYPYQQTQESASGAVRIGLAAGRPVAVTPLSIFDDVSDAVARLPGTEPAAIAAGIRDLLANSKVLAETVEQAEQWNASRQWPLLSVRLMNIIDGLANDFGSDARHV